LWGRSWWSGVVVGSGNVVGDRGAKTRRSVAVRTSGLGIGVKVERTNAVGVAIGVVLMEQAV